MKIAIFVNDEETIVVGLHEDGSPMDNDGTLFGPESGRDIDDFESFHPDFKKGESFHLETLMNGRIKG